MKKNITVLMVISALLLASCGSYNEPQNTNPPDDEYFDTLSELTARQAKELENNPHALSENYGGSYLDMENEKVVICLVGVEELPEDSSDGVVTYRSVDFNYATLDRIVDEIIPGFLEDYPDLHIALGTHDYQVWVGLKEPEGPVADALREYVHKELGLADEYPSPLKIEYLPDMQLIEE